MTRTLPEEEDPGAATVVCDALGTEVSGFAAPVEAGPAVVSGFEALGATDGLPTPPGAEKKID